MKKLTLSLVVAAVAFSLTMSFLVSPVAPRAWAAPPSHGEIIVPLLSVFRACDFTTEGSPGSRGTARAVARVGSTGSGTITATVDVAPAKPNTFYQVRLIQVPRPSIGCAPGAPGVVTGGLQTDAFGAGSTRLEGPIESGATGAWVIVERRAPFSQTPAEFYTSGFVAAI